MSDSRSNSPTEKTAIKSQHFTQDLTEITDERTPRRKAWCIWFPRRYWVSMMAFFGFCNLYALRSNLSVAIVAMTNNQSFTIDGEEHYIQEFPWSPSLQGIVLGSFFYGYILSQIPGGWLAARHGGKRVFGIGIAVTSLITLITPLLARASIYLLVLGRVIEGIFEGVSYPSIHALWSVWAPPLERSKLSTFGFSGSYFGTVLSFTLSGLLADTIGWPYIFYFFGTFALIWSIIWWFYVADAPSIDPYICEEELELIRSSLGSTNHFKTVSPPWKRFFTSLPVWAIIIAHFSENMGFYTLLTELPHFMKDVLKFDLKSAGLFSALPYLVMGVMVQIGGYFADYLRFREHMTTTQVRKLCNCGAFIFQALFLLAAAHSSTPTAVVANLTVAVGLGGFAWAGFSVNHLDLAPQFASILMGISNTVATIPGMISPLLTEHLVQNKTHNEWQAVFYIPAGIYLGGAIFYGMFASGEKQKWAHIPDSLALCRDDDSHASTEDLPFGAGNCE